MENQTITENLHNKVSNILEQYQILKEKNEALTTNILTMSQALEDKTKELEKRIEDDAMKDLELEDIIVKIENILK
ncbi:MAG: hypothetical protein QM493_04975 [Sulfurovum sp.]